ncbi:MAG: hypothetical protein ACK5HT_15015 [Draconibacterium sp.]
MHCNGFKIRWQQVASVWLGVASIQDLYFYSNNQLLSVCREVWDKLHEIVRKLGGKRMNVSGFIENLAL